jgi:hypothetical protein
MKGLEVGYRLKHLKLCLEILRIAKFLVFLEKQVVTFKTLVSLSLL